MGGLRKESKMAKTILDVSRHQGVVGWDKVKASGNVDGVMIRALGTSNGKPYIDPQFARNYAECTRLGLPVGIYWYSTAATKAAADAELTLLHSVLAGKTLQLPVALDLEATGLRKLGKSALTDLAAYELAQLERWGLYAMLYTYLDFAQNCLHMGGAALKPYDVWLAAYRAKKPATDFAYGMWQYTSTARVPGIAVDVDLSEAYKDYPAIIQCKGLGGPVKGS